MRKDSHEKFKNLNARKNVQTKCVDRRYLYTGVKVFCYIRQIQAVPSLPIHRLHIRRTKQLSEISYYIINLVSGNYLLKYWMNSV